MATQSAASLPLNARSFHAFATQLVQAGNIGVIPVGTPFGEFGPMGTTPQPISSLNLPDPHLPYTRKGAPERIASTSAGHREVDAARNFLQYHVDEAVSAAERIMGNVPLRTSASQFFAEGSRKFSEGDYRDGYIDSLHSAAVFLRLGELSDVINARSALEFSRASLRRIALDFPAAAILAECKAEVTELILRKLGSLGNVLDGGTISQIRSSILPQRKETPPTADPYWKSTMTVRTKMESDRNKAAWTWQQLLKLSGRDLRTETYMAAAYRSIVNACASKDPYQLAFSFSRSAKVFAFNDSNEEAALHYLRAVSALTRPYPLQPGYWKYISKWMAEFESHVRNDGASTQLRNQFTPELHGLMGEMIEAAEFYTAIDNARLGPNGEVAIEAEAFNITKVRSENLYGPVGKRYSTLEEYSTWWSGLSFKEQGRLVIAASQAIVDSIGDGSCDFDNVSNLIIINDELVGAAFDEVSRIFGFQG